ncbi:MAG: AMP-binding protein [Candidatus Heimdallarchaeota archaeon]|nr:MAG: long-chain fatty acid--CoA ligase [Candidatus Gerdarchaeota archaeon]RLI72478.1 MAG: long-chain fatty acid--CoA ligase [Candidatus Heimdallarchaeota archaeon]
MARWHSLYHEKIPPEIEVPNISLGEMFFEVAAKNHEKPFLYFQGKKKTYGEAAEEVRRLGNALQELGVKKGDRVAILLPNCPQFVISYLSILAIGGTVTAISSLLTEKDIKFQLNDSGSVALITLDLFLDKVRAVREETPALKHVIVSSIADELSSIKGFLYKTIIGRKNPKPTKEELRYKQIIKNGKNISINVTIDPKEHLAALQYTGGTTGTPKGAMLTHYNLVSQTVVLDAWMEWIGGKLPGVQDTNIGALPFSHIFGLTTSFLWPMSIGGMIVLIPDPRKLEELMKTIQNYRIHFFMAVPTLFQKLAEHPKVSDYDWSSLRICISGGSALHPDILREFEEKTGALLVEGYGLSEASPVTHVNPADRVLRRIGIGLPIPNTEAKIVDIKTGETIPEVFDSEKKTAEGELLVRGPQVMKGYWNKPEETKKVLTPDGWLRTGDVAKMTEEGYFEIVDRLKDCIFTSGFQVWPLEIETILCNHPDISLAAVIPYKDENLNELIKAIIVAREGAPKYDEKELRAYCKKHLAPYKVPKIFEYREELPLSPVGKVLRRPLREEVVKIAVQETK